MGGVHVLPFYPSSADRGFAPLTYKQVDPSFGKWRDISALRQRLDVCVDFMVNHISAQSEQFKDFVEKGDEVCPCSRVHRLANSAPPPPQRTPDHACICTFGSARSQRTAVSAARTAWTCLG